MRPARLSLASRVARSIVPRSVAQSVTAIRQDARHLAARILGETRESPFTSRPAVEPNSRVRLVNQTTAAALKPRTLRVASVIRETPDAVSLVLEDPRGGTIEFAAGQFLTVQIVVGDRALRRAYSLSSAATDFRTATITVKRVANGQVSSELVDHAREGMSLSVFGPSGHFVLSDDDRGVQDLVLVGGGSGITPLMSLAQTALAQRPNVRVVLLYGNRSAQDVIFREALDALCERHPNRLRVQHVLEIPLARSELGTITSALTPARLDADTIRDFLEPRVRGDAALTRIFVCGPDGMMSAARTALNRLGVPAHIVREERFAQPHLRAPTAGNSNATTQTLTLRRGGIDRAIAVPPGQTILEAAVANGVPMDFSCTMGGCGACRVRCVTGVVEMEEPNCLTAAERANGEILACVGRLAGSVTIEAPR